VIANGVFACASFEGMELRIDPAGCAVLDSGRP
jgi:hypothetical protein